MPVWLLADFGYSNYISPVKLAIFAAMFFIWLPLVGWIYLDAKAVKTKEVFWTGVVFGTGAVATVIWLLLPSFAIGVVLYVIAVGTSCISYLMHRDAMVSEYDRVLTVSNLQSLLLKKDKKTAVEAKRGIVFITANKNEVEPPEMQTPEFSGYKIAGKIFEDALWRRTSEIVLAPIGHNYTIVYRIDGIVSKQPEKTKEEAENFIYFLKLLADLDVSEKRKPQRGVFSLRKDGSNIQWQVNTAGSVAGEQVRVLRVESQEVLKLDELGLNLDQLAQLKALRDIKGGLFIVCGPKKSGVTTTFYALLRNHDPFINAINTLERNPAASLPNITQNVYSLSDTGTTSFAKRLQSLLRTGPDIVGVADCQDQQTAFLAASAAKNIRVYVTLEAENAVQAVGKWMKLVNDPALAVDTLLGITSQRLLRNLCPECKQAYEPNREQLRKLNIPPEKIKQLYKQGEPQTDRRGRPILCPKCQSTGFFGRFAVLETIVFNDELKNAIKQAKSLQDIVTSFRRARLLFLQEQALRKVVDGTTAINELIREFSRAERSAKPASVEQKG